MPLAKYKLTIATENIKYDIMCVGLFSKKPFNTTITPKNIATSPNIKWVREATISFFSITNLYSLSPTMSTNS